MPGEYTDGFVKTYWTIQEHSEELRIPQPLLLFAGAAPALFGSCILVRLTSLLQQNICLTMLLCSIQDRKVMTVDRFLTITGFTLKTTERTSEFTKRKMILKDFLGNRLRLH